jgi:ATP-dependent DNA helicase RecG
MNRLLQGDVGSGKTLIAIASMLSAVDSGYQAALMAPTEVLARQHYIRVKETLGRMGIRCALLTSGFSQPEREARLKGIASGEIDVVIGTHALIQEDVTFFKLGLVVIDEQHRFGVLQRQTLASKGLHPHVLVMTATPIPRTLAISVYGDLSISVLDEFPPGRKDVTTRWVRRKELAKLYDFIRTEAMAGRQIYWVCPVIEESESQNVTSVLERYENLKETFADLRVGLMHGQLKSGDKDEVYEDFVGGKLDILVSTSVIEVGIDVPNATAMVIEDAHRFGLSQLHQLRGRVGRGSHKSYCFLLGEPSTPEGVERLKVLCATQSGFDIAESDLRLRGPGEICGTRQHGITDFRVADLLRDASLLEMAREDANELISLDPNLEEFPSLKAKLLASLGEGLSLALTG